MAGPPCSDRRQAWRTFGDMPDAHIVASLVAEADLRDREPREKHPPNPIRGGWPEGQVQPGESLRQLDTAAMETRGAVLTHPANLVGGIILGFGQAIGKGDRAWPVAGCRHRQSQRRVRPL